MELDTIGDEKTVLFLIMSDTDTTFNFILAIERDIERLKEKISEYQQQLKELESAKTEQENLQIIQLVRSMNMKPDEFATFLRSGALNAAPTVTPYHKQEDAADET